VPLRNSDDTLNFICEIPKESSAKMEVATKEEKNPIKQDIKKGVRAYENSPEQKESIFRVTCFDSF